MSSQAPAPAKQHAAPVVPAVALPAKKSSFSDLTPLLERNPPSKVEIQDEIAKLRATAKSLGIENDDISNHPEVNRIFNTVQGRSLSGVDPIRDIRDHASTGVSIKEDDVPSPLFFSKLFSVAESLSDKRATAQTFAVLKEVEKHMLHIQNRKAERKNTDVKIGANTVPVEIFESAPMQAYSASMANINAQFDRMNSTLDKQQGQVRKLRQDMESEQERIREISINELMARYPLWLADIQLSQKEHRWFERAMEGDDDDVPVAKKDAHHH
jgi:hypothetical protein